MQTNDLMRFYSSDELSITKQFSLDLNVGMKSLHIFLGYLNKSKIHPRYFSQMTD